MPEIVPPALNPTAMQSDPCVAACYDCARLCLETVMEVCLPAEGKHADSKHIGLMLGCAQVCRATAEFISTSDVLQAKVAAVCAEVCEACAHSCAEIGGMDACVTTCRRCAEACRRLALGSATQ